MSYLDSRRWAVRFLPVDGLVLVLKGPRWLQRLNGVEYGRKEFHMNLLNMGDLPPVYTL